jgi:hypothetical protein
MSTEQFGPSAWKVPIRTAGDAGLVLRRLPHLVVLAAGSWITFAAGLTLAGWILGEQRLIEFPTQATSSMMTPITSINLLISAALLWLLPTNVRLTGGAGGSPRVWQLS